MRLPRPYIPIATRLIVAERQIEQLTGVGNACRRFDPLSQTKLLELLLGALFGDKKVELHHRPALVNRRRKRNGDYDPPANDPNYLVYLPEDEHDIETRVRGLHGQHSDLAIVRKRKRKERKTKRPKRKWASRPLRSANRWPKRSFRQSPSRVISSTNRH